MRKLRALIVISSVLLLTMSLAQAASGAAVGAGTIVITKVANPPDLPAGGGSVTYTYHVTASGGPLSTVAVTDDMCAPVTFVSGDGAPIGQLDVGEIWIYTCTTNLTQTTSNTATATAKDVVGAMTTATAKATVTVPAIAIAKVATPTSLPFGGGPVTYTYTVTDPGGTQLMNVVVVDDTCAPVVFTGGDTNANTFLDPGEVWTYSCTKTVTATTVNTATVTAVDVRTGSNVTAKASATVHVAPPRSAGISIAKAALPTTLPAGGGSVTYTYTVTNPVGIPLTSVTVTDNRCAPVTFVSGDTNANNKLDAGETWIYTCTTVITITTTNTAVATGTDPNGGIVTSTAQATVTVPPCAPGAAAPVCTPTAPPCPSTAPACTPPPCPATSPCTPTPPPCAATSPACTPPPCPATSPCTPTAPPCPASAPACTPPPCPGTSPCTPTPAPCPATAAACTPPGRTACPGAVPCTPPIGQTCPPDPNCIPRSGIPLPVVTPPDTDTSGLGEQSTGMGMFRLVIAGLMVGSGIVMLVSVPYLWGPGRRRRNRR